MTVTIQIIMVCLFFAIGMTMIVSGLLIIVAREYQDTMRTLSSQSTRLSGKAITDLGVQPALEGTAHLVESITSLVRTAIGTGAFLCLLGTLICGISFWMLQLVPALP